MLLSHTNGFIYTKTLKTAGTSVEIYFEDACITPGNSAARGHHIEEMVTPAGIVGYRGPDQTGHRWYNHMSAREIRELIGHALWGEYYKFCVVRNPFDKVVSHWWFAVNSRGQYPHKEDEFSKIKSDFSQWCIRHASDVVDHDKYVIDGRLAMDYCIKYESLLDGIERVCRRVDYPFRPERLGKYKSDSRTSSRPFSEYYDRVTIATVAAAFNWELDQFGYDRPSETGVST